MSEYCFHAQELLRLATDARDRARDETTKKGHPHSREAITAIVMAFAAAEGFINEMGELYGPNNTNPQPGLPEQVRDFGKLLTEMEASRCQTPEKYRRGASVFTGQLMDRGRQPFQEFARLFRIRNLVIHPKLFDQSMEVDASGEGSYRYPDDVLDLQQRRIALGKEDLFHGWLYCLQGSKVAEWACKSSGDMMLTLADLFPHWGPAEEKTEVERWAGWYRMLLGEDKN